jgi:hypothetical protein
MSTYYSHKTILTPIYTKAVVLDGGIHIRPFNPDEVYGEEEEPEDDLMVEDSGDDEDDG